jgi:glycosyltransferase involved in cell wall biosynthesis
MVTLLRCTPSMTARNSCVRGSVSLISKSRVCRSQRHNLSSRSCAALHAASCWVWAELIDSCRTCGLSQMYAQRFGSLPIGNRTGGLAETIADGRTAFLFERPSVESFFGALCRAFAKFSNRPALNAMRREAMALSYGWERPASAYTDLYRRLVT